MKFIYVTILVVAALLMCVAQAQKAFKPYNPTKKDWKSFNVEKARAHVDEYRIEAQREENSLTADLNKCDASINKEQANKIANQEMLDIIKKERAVITVLKTKIVKLADKGTTSNIREVLDGLSDKLAKDSKYYSAEKTAIQNNLNAALIAMIKSQKRYSKDKDSRHTHLKKLAYVDITLTEKNPFKKSLQNCQKENLILKAKLKK